MSYKIYKVWSAIAGIFLLTAMACNLDLSRMFQISKQDILMFVFIVIGGTVLIGIIMIFVVAGNSPKK